MKDEPPFTILLKDAVTKTYHFQGWKIQVGYLNGHSVRIAYSKLPKPNESPRIEDDEIEVILKAETHGGQWSRFKAASLFSIKDSGNHIFDHAPFRWTNTNKSIAYSPMGGMKMYVETREAVIWEQSIKNEKEVVRKESIPKF